MTFPAEAVPDGNVFAPHHFYIGVILAWFGFQYVWPHYSKVGASMTLLGLYIATEDVLNHAFGIPTPLDWMWKHGGRDMITFD